MRGFITNTRMFENVGSGDEYGGKTVYVLVM